MRADIVEVVEQIDRELRALGTPERAEHEARYLKSGLAHYGTGVPDTRSAVKAALRAVPELGRTDLLQMVGMLWGSKLGPGADFGSGTGPPVHERRLAAVEVLVARHRLLDISDAAVIEQMVREARTWALIDPLATGVVSPLVERDPDWGALLDQWSTDSDFWVRRSALLALLVPLRRGEGDWDRFARYADAMLDEREFFIRKAIGWVLRDTAKRRPDLVANWLLPRAGRASGVTVREAVKPLSPSQRAAIVAAYSNRV